MNAREKAAAARVARQRIIAGAPSSDDIITGAVQPNDGGGAWVHCMVFVPAVALDECADCGGSTAPGSPDPHECAPAPLTADTITDAEIRELREQAFANGMQTTVLICTVALGEDRWDDALHGYRKPTLDEQRNCRARCAEILNARGKEGK